MLKAIIFDFDGIIVDTELNRFHYLQNELKNYGYAIKKIDFPKIFGKKMSLVLKEFFPQMPERLVSEIVNKRRSEFKHSIIKLKPIPGLDKFLSYVSERYRLAITTGNTREVVERFLSFYNLDEYFDVLVCGDEFNKSKPDPEGFNLALKKLKINPENVIIIEDSQSGIMAAKKINCKVFGLQNKYNKKQIKLADKSFISYRHMQKYFKLTL